MSAQRRLAWKIVGAAAIVLLALLAWRFAGPALVAPPAVPTPRQPPDPARLYTPAPQSPAIYPPPVPALPTDKELLPAAPRIVPPPIVPPDLTVPIQDGDALDQALQEMSEATQNTQFAPTPKGTVVEPAPAGRER